VVQVFKNNGAGKRGDLAAVTRAILLDPEARGARKIDPEYGRLREPALLWTAMLRALDVVTDGFVPATTNYRTQPLFAALTVFSYYPADYVLPGTATPAPEFGIYTSAAFIDRANQINGLLYNSEFTYASEFLPKPYVVNASRNAEPRPHHVPGRREPARRARRAARPAVPARHDERRDAPDHRQTPSTSCRPPIRCGASSWRST
jgi:hypothetical protein